MNEVGGLQPGQSFELPPPEEAGERPDRGLEKAKPATEAAPAKQAASTPAPQLPAIPDVPTSVPATPPSDNAAPAISAKTAKLPAKEGNLIEKQWVQKAKEIVAETKSDPYKQKNEMSKAKADYIQKRFKKTVKTDGAVA